MATFSKKTEMPSLLEESTLFRTIAESTAAGLYIIEDTGRFAYVNPAAAALSGYSQDEVLNKTFLDVVHPEFRTAAVERWQSRLHEEPVPWVETKIVTKTGEERWVDFTVTPMQIGPRRCWLGTVIDVTERHRAERRAGGLQEVLEMVAKGEPLAVTLDALLRFVEEQLPETLSSILLLDPDGVHVRHGAAPRLPAGYTEAIDGEAIGPTAGSCGTAAFRREPVFVRDIETDPLWASYKTVALNFGLRACWSTPILDSQQTVLGTFALYFRQPGLPQEYHIQLIRQVTSVAAICIKRSQQEEAQRSTLETLRATLEITGAQHAANETLVRSPDLQSVLAALLQSLENLVPYDSANVMLFDSKGYLVPAAIRGYGRWTDIEDTASIQFDLRSNAALRRVVESAKPLLIGDTRELPGWERPKGAEHVISWFGVPLIVANKVIGIYSVDKTQPHFFTAEHVRLAETLAGQAAVAIQNAILHNDLREREHQLRLFVEHSPAAIAMFDREMRYLVASKRWLSDYNVGSTDVVGRSHYEIFPDLPERWKGIYRRCLAGAIARCEEDPFPRANGTLDWVHWEVHPWRKAGGEVGGVIIFSELITERKLAAEKLRASEKLLRELIDGLGPSMFVGLLSPEGILVEVNRPALEIAGLQPEDTIGKRLEDTYWLSYDESVRQRIRGAITRGAAGEASRYDEVIRVAKDQFAVIDFSMQPLLDEVGKVRYLVPSAREITDRKRAEDGLRALAGQLLQAQDEERRRLSREIHDSMGQTVAAVALNLGQLADAKGVDSKVCIAQTRELVGQLSREIRSLSYLLHPPLLEELGLVPAIRSYVRGFSERTGIDCHVDLAAKVPRLAAEKELSLFRVLQESLGNIQRHSGSKTANVALRVSADGILLEVQDQGRGFPCRLVKGLQQGDTAGLGVGILGMRERLRQLGGSLSVESTPAGAVVRALLPHQKQADA